MAIPLPNALLPLKHEIFRSNSCLPVTPVRRLDSLNISSTTRSITTAARVLSRTSESLSSIITELEKDQNNENLEKEDHDDDQTERQIADVWREIHGQDDWVGLLDPMDPVLRSELIRYGEMAQTCYDAFDFDPYSKYCGSCRFPRRKFFDSLGMSHLGYDITRYLYATSNINLPNFFKKSRWPKVWSRNANWIGYVAVSNDETSKRLGRRDITIAWRGTVTRLEWIADLMDFLKPISSLKIPCPDRTVKVEYGFVDLYTDKDDSCRFCKFSAREQILSEVKKLLDMYQNEEISITITGHSLGAALAILSAFDIAETGVHVLKDSRAVPVSVFSFAGPRVGNVRFKERIESLGVKVLRVVNVHDMVPKSPGFLFNEQAPPMVMKLAEGLPWSYSHVGVELALDHKNSPFLKETGDPVGAHNLEAHLHLLDGYHGKGHRFVLSSGRDPALVNKGSDFLKDHYLVPPYWRQDENKGLVRGNDGRWMQPERSKLDDHPSDMHQHLIKLGLASRQ
ncbi:phospholipase A1-Igamma1 chloroplastic-like [Tripterygium wilfordii]|uniref:Phospholipase A1-Igamma1 chloroplastic-like n=1 Tax=Tripterygium wilfordii TaxID=458696 RepID=A0A7J7CXR9_TRIWF|nr:phospholipase A1-Igamma1, chloroplastic-like [Tripterygium wilfordii]KAF5738891.1 phospholipase A1-Igamma1 chloroplastic-like [Tripterygium wilfordii]